MAAVKGGEKLSAWLKTTAKKLAQPRVLRVGFLENARYPDGKYVAMIAAIHNYGAPRANIPPRPFFTNMIAKHKGEWPAAIAGLIKAHGYDLNAALDEAGHAIVGQLREEIMLTNAPPLRPATIRRKGFSKPLIGGGVTGGHMYNSVDHEVNTS